MTDPLKQQTPASQDGGKGWTAIPFAPGYEVHPSGKVRSTARNWRGYGIMVLSSCPNHHGYDSVRLTVDGKRKHYATHSIVAAVLLPPRPSPKHEVRHLDGNKLNPAAENLQWGTAKDNADDRAAHGTTAKGERVNTARLTETKVREIRRRVGSTTWVALAAEFGVTPKTVRQIASRRSWVHVAEEAHV